MSSDLSINPTLISFMACLLSFLRLIHSNCPKRAFSCEEKTSLFLANVWRCSFWRKHHNTFPEKPQGCHLMLPFIGRGPHSARCLGWQAALALQLGLPSQQDGRQAKEGHFPGDGTQGCWTSWPHTGPGRHPSKVEAGMMANGFFPDALCRAPSLPASAMLRALPANFLTRPVPHFAQAERRLGAAFPWVGAKGPQPARHLVPACLTCSWGDGQNAAHQCSAMSRILTNRFIPAHTARSNTVQETIWDPY